ncbi:MAG: response regulator, partial [Verrucomicrobiae bacterium]|nr:response regulator [Verrucomicrobiae bacterium]
KPVDRDRLSRVMAKYHAHGKKRRVLVVDDDPATRDLLKRALEGVGWDVEEAENGRIGVERVLSGAPDLVLLDLLMPEMDGFEFLQVIRCDLRLTDLPIIVLTAKDLTEDDRERLNGCVNRVLAKGGLSPAELIRQIRAVLRPDSSHPVIPPGSHVHP